jgi:hypothetical protein
MATVVDRTKVTSMNRTLLLAAPLLTIAVAACSDGEPAGETFTIQTPSFTLQPGEEKFYCYYTTLPTDDVRAIHAMASHMTPGSHHMIVFKTQTEQAPDGTFVECQNFGMGDDLPVWLYASQDPDQEMTLPDDIAIALPARQPVLVNMHYINQTDAPLTADVHVELTALPAGTHYHEAHAYITFNDQIDIAPGAIGSVTGTCDVDPAVKFVALTTHSHRYTTSAQVFDDTTPVLETLDWEHAAVERYGEPYLQFSSGKLTYRCTYHNTTSEPLTTGESALSNEMCMAVGLYFPASRDTYCLNSFTL